MNARHSRKFVLMLFLAITSIRAQPLQWSKLTPSTSPPPATRVAMAYDVSRDRAVMFHWDTLTTWEYDGITWLPQAPLTTPLLLYGASMAYDTGRRRTVLLTTAGTWEWNGTNWSRFSTGLLAELSGMCYDTTRGRVASYGGISGASYYTNVLAYFDGASWTSVNTANPWPSARGECGLAYDSVRRRLVLFGGVDNVGLLGDTWEWDGTVWMRLQPAHIPPARRRPVMFYDSRRGQTVLFGGFNNQDLGDLWEWDGSDWRAVTMNPLPSPRNGHGMCWDDSAGRGLLFGGGASFLPQNDTWVLMNRVVAAYTTFGLGCQGTRGIPFLVAVSPPRMGQTMQLVVGNLPIGRTPFLATGNSRTVWGGLTLPFDLSVIGMAGCYAHISNETAIVLQNTGGSAITSLTIPSDIRLVGLRFYNQCYVFEPTANILGMIASNGGEGLIGQ